MGTVVVRIDMPPVDPEGGGGTSPSDDQMQKEQDARQAFMDHAGPKLEEIASRPLSRTGNITRIELLGGSEWSKLNQYLLLVSTDIGVPHVDWADLVPPGGTATAMEGGPYASLRQWPDKE
jgi:hypothetical protein